MQSEEGKLGRIHRLLEALCPYGPERVYLFGSYARGEEDDVSDLDVVVILRTTLPFFERMRQLGGNLPPTLGGVDLLVYTPEEWMAMRAEGNAFVEMLVEEGQVIYERQAED